MLEEIYTPITETNKFIVLDKYEKLEQGSSYQTESDLECEFIADLQNQGYEYRTDLNSQEALLQNVRRQLETLNNVQFLDSEWQRFLTEYLDKPSENIIDKTRKIHHDHIYDFVFDNGRIQNIYLVDKSRSLAIRCKSLTNLNRLARTLIAMTLLFWSMVCHWCRLS
ncbi:type I site-specific deoxyribonuclease [Actinobacillus pleuropneumoniae]|nr:type I site-specific deoxyribonuclease [Actinobacillus pleuropneumoniae]